MLDKRDVALQTLTPSVMVPRFSEIEKLEQSGHRFCIASDGLWMEVKRPWLELCVPLAQQYVVNMPYGPLKEKMRFNFGKLNINFLQQFLKEAKEHLPNECAAWFIWNEGTHQMRFEMLVADVATSGSITYQCPVLEDGEHLIADIHSHGEGHAFFSFQDNDDDRTEVKIAVVIGNVDTDMPTMKMRLCANGYFIDLPCDGLGTIGGFDA
jgi:PRTRC genetic system protein A